MTFKALIKMIAEIKTEDNRNECYGAIDASFCKEKITWAEHEMLYEIAGRIAI